MKISGELFEVLNNSYWGSKEKEYALLVYAFLHKTGVITDEKLKGALSTIRTGKFFRRLRTYHCQIQNRWYDSESTDSLLTDLVDYFDLKYKIMTVDELVEYVRLLHNKNYNWCINYIYEQYYKKPLQDVTDYNYYRYNNVLVHIDQYLKIEEHSRESSGYDDCCCCCGCCSNSYYYDDYKRRYYREEAVRITKQLVQMFNNKKKGRWNLAPYQLESL